VVSSPSDPQSIVSSEKRPTLCLEAIVFCFLKKENPRQMNIMRALFQFLTRADRLVDNHANAQDDRVRVVFHGSFKPSKTMHQ